jgi:hypothetical protein
MIFNLFYSLVILMIKNWKKMKKIPTKQLIQKESNKAKMIA